MHDETSKRHISLPYAIVTDAAAPAKSDQDTQDTTALGPPPELGRREHFRVAQRVSFIDRELRHRVGLIVRVNQQTATLDCDGQTWRVAFGLLHHIVDV